MNIIVCIKRVPDTADADIFIDKSGKDIEKGGLAFDLNEWDSYAIEEAIQLKEKLGGTVTVLSAGGEDSNESLRKCLAMGADDAFRLTDPAFAGADGFATARILAEAIRKRPFDLILTGTQAEDDGYGQVGVVMAEMLAVVSDLLDHIHRQRILVPEMKGGYVSSMNAWDMVKRDRGGMLFTPQVGLHENVGCIDFESMFPSIISRRNVSYETVTEEGVDMSQQGFMGCFTGPTLERRFRFKHMRGQFPRGSREWMWCEERQSSLKLMLVVIYGYSGCYANRFANVQVFQEINRQARQALVKGLSIALSHGFEVVYGNTDALYAKKEDVTEVTIRNRYTELKRVLDLDRFKPERG